MGKTKMKKMNKKKAGVVNIPLSIVGIILVLSFIIGIMVIAKAGQKSSEIVKEEFEAGNELLQIQIGLEEVENTSTITTTYTTTSGTATQTITTTTTTPTKISNVAITIKNIGKRTSIIDYFVIERWDLRILKQGELNPPLELGVGEQKVIKGNEILSTFNLNDPAYADNYLFFKENVRCIYLHTKLGNVFGSSYSPLKQKTITLRIWEINISATMINQTTTTTYTGSFKLFIESHGPFKISPRDDNPKWYRIYEYNDDTHTHYVWGDGISPNSDPYGRPYDDGEYTYPSGILLTVSHSFRSFPCHWIYKKVYVSNVYNSIGPYSSLNMYVAKMELWEVDQSGNEIRKVLETTSNSITFTMNRNYKLKRYFGYSATEYQPPITTVTYTTTATTTQTLPPRLDHFDVSYLGKNGTIQHDIITISKPEGYSEIKYDHWEVNRGREWMAKDPDVDVRKNGPDELIIYVTVYLKENTPDDQGILLEIWYKLK